MAETNVVSLHDGITPPNVGPSITLQALAEGAEESGVWGAILIGRDKDGELYVAAQDPGVDHTVAELLRAANYMASQAPS